MVFSKQILFRSDRLEATNGAKKMTTSITLDKISQKFPGKVLFADVIATFNRGERYGLTGPNGAGKSTLMKIIMGFLKPTSGQVILPDRVGFLRQNIEDFAEYSLIDTVIMGNSKLWAAMEKRDKLYEMEMTDEIGMELAHLEEVVAEEDGYSADSEAEILLTGMAIDPSLHQKKMKELPTDKQFSVLLCQALFGNPDALLLDEPTNHLDLESIGWLEEFLFNYKGTLIVISHDRHFLNAVTTQIADIDYDTVIVYPGNYDNMVHMKTQVRKTAEDENKAKEKKIAQLKEFVAKFGAGTRASQVQSRVKEIEKLKPEDLKKTNIQRPYIRFTPPEKQPGQLIFKVDQISKAYDHPVIKDFSFEMLRGDKIAVIGNNGMGKTTLLKMLAGVIKPDSGEITPGHGTTIGYFSQNHADIMEDVKEGDSFSFLKAQKQGIYDQEIRSYLGKLLFAGDDAFKKVKNLSGGETARLIIAKLMLQEPNVLVLDEPNNHLDLEAVSALAWGLEEFKGSVIFASHDRDLISKAATKIISFEKEGPIFFHGSYEEYLLSKKS